MFNCKCPECRGGESCTPRVDTWPYMIKQIDLIHTIVYKKRKQIIILEYM